MKIAFFSCFLFFTLWLLGSNDVKIKKKTTYHRNYGVGDGMGLYEIIEFDTIGRIIVKNQYHPYQNNILLNSISTTYYSNKERTITCKIVYEDKKNDWVCDTITFENSKFDTIHKNSFQKHHIKVNNRHNYSDTIFFYKNKSKKNQIIHIINRNTEKIIRRCYQGNGGCLHHMFGRDYDSLYEYYEEGKLLREVVFLRNVDDEEESQCKISYIYNQYNLLTQIDICHANSKNCEWKVKIAYEYY